MEETIRTFHRVLSVSGITIFAKTNWDSKLWLFWQIFNVVSGLLTIVVTTGYVIANMSDVHACIQGGCIWGTGLIMFISFAVCLYYRKQFRQFLKEICFKDVMLEMPLIEYVLNLEQKGRLNKLKSMVLESQEKLLKLSRVLLKSYVVLSFVCATLYLSDSVYLMFTNEDDSLRILAFPMWIPWSLQNFKVYLATYGFSAFCGYLCCIAYPGVQLTIFLMVGQIIRQLRILTFILLNLDELVLEIAGHRGQEWQTYCTTVLSQCAHHYVKLKDFSNKLNVICRPFYLALILDGIMLVCLCSVKIAISNKTSPDTMKYYVHGFVFTIFPFAFCLLGQQVENECARLETAVTENWYIFDRKHKVHVRIFKMALSQRMPISIFGTITLSAPTFTWFIKTGMSFFTLVMSVLEHHEI